MPESDFQEFLLALSAAGVKHLVVDAYAMASHGHVRATGDLDTWIEPTLANARRLSLAVQEFAGVPLGFFGVSPQDLTGSGTGFYMGIEPDRIDVHTALAGVSFARAWEGRMTAQSFGVRTEVLGLADLIAAKRASISLGVAGSSKALQDASDLAWLVAKRARDLHRLHRRLPKKRR